MASNAYVTCKQCNGTKKIKGMGMIEVPCKACNETGLVLAKPVNQSPDIEDSKKTKTRKKKSDA